MIRLLADKHIYKLENFLPEEVHLTSFDPNIGLPVSLDGFGAIFTRTVTKINETTVPTIPGSLKLVGTASAGTDHYDRSYLAGHNVGIADAKGCNANAVAEYVITALLIWSETRNIDLSEIKVGVIGAGFTGSAVIRQLDNFGIRHIAYDPPREQRDSNFTSAGIEEVLACDILTFHTPLIEHGELRTKYWLNKEILEHRSFELIINAARGGIIDEQALLKAKKDGTVKDYILDVWENEPSFSARVAQNAFIATPHIAGYSEQAKLNISKILVHQLCDAFEIQNSDQVFSFPKKAMSLKSPKSKSDLLKALHPMVDYDSDLRELFSKPEKEREFAHLRVNRPYRFEYSHMELDVAVVKNFPFLGKLDISTLNR